MKSIAAKLREYWGQRHLIPKGAWVLLLVYSLVVFGSPMPPKITWLEIVMGCGLLIGAIALAGSVFRMVQQQKSAKWCLGLAALLFLMPLCVGWLRGNALSDMARDIFPIAFLVGIPILFIYSASDVNRAAMRTLMVTVLVFVGIWSAATFFSGALDLVGTMDRIELMVRAHFVPLETFQISQASQTEFDERQREIIIKLFDPAMLFTSIFFSAWGGLLMVRSWRGCLPGMILAGGGVLIGYGFMILGLRAYSALYVLAVLTIGLTQIRERGLYVRLLPVFFVTCALCWPQILEVLQLLWIKQQVIGVSAKMGEWTAVINLVLLSPQTTLFGIGWGGMYNNPILNENVRFTHSVLSFYLLKSGLLGLTALLSIIAILIFQGSRFGDSETLTTPRLILLASCLMPLLIGILFEPTYKMLSYGVILTLFVLSSVSIKSEENRINGRK